MATKKTTTVAKAKAPASASALAQKAFHQSLITSVIAKPRITEKATQVAEGNVYTFTVLRKATKTQVKEAIVKLYKVTPRKINIVNVKQKQVFVRGKFGTQAGSRKAYVFLKKGDKIELM